MRTPFHGHIADGLRYDPQYDMWVKFDGADVLIGATSFGIHLAGEIIAFTAKPKGAEVQRARGLGTIECAKTVLAVHAPVSFKLIEGNEALEEHPAQLNHDPYAAWMVRGRATDRAQDELQLIDASAYRAHILKLEPAATFR